MDTSNDEILEEVKKEEQEKIADEEVTFSKSSLQ